MEELGREALVRRVYRDNSRVQLGVLSPRIKMKYEVGPLLKMKFFAHVLANDNFMFNSVWSSMSYRKRKSVLLLLRSKSDKKMFSPDLVTTCDSLFYHPSSHLKISRMLNS